MIAPQKKGGNAIAQRREKKEKKKQLKLRVLV